VLYGVGDLGGFTPQASANELGVYTLLGWTFSCISDAVYPFPMELVKLVRNTFDPDFLLLWCESEYKSPNDGRLRTGNFVLARHVRNPHHDPIDKVVMKGRYQSGLLLPTTPAEAAIYKPPIVVAQVLDGLNDDDRRLGRPPRFEPFTMRKVKEMRWAKWVRENFTPDEVTASMAQTAADENERAWDRVKAATNYRRRNDKDTRQYATGKRVSMEGMEVAS
jgi:hypothetical protein